METKKVLTIIFSCLFVAIFAFVLVWGIINFNKVKDGISGTGIYTQEDVNNAYQDGYDTALTNKAEYDQLISEYRDNITTLNDTISQLNTQVANLTKGNQDYANQINNLNQIKAENENLISSLEEVIEDNNNTISGLNNEIGDMQNQISDLNAIIGERDNQIESLNSQIQVLEGQITNLQNMVNQLQITNNLNLETIKTLNTQNANLNNRILTLSNQVISNDNSMSSLNSRIAELEESVAYYEQYIATLESDTEIVVTFEFAGSVYNIQVVSRNSIVSVVEPANTEFVIFNYWTINGEQVDLTNYQFTTNTKVIADVTYFYQIKFLTDGALYGETQIIEQGNTLSLPEDPTKDKHKFIGWSLDGKEIVENIDTLPVNEDLTYIAVFETNIYATFMNGEEVYEAIQVVDGKIPSIPEGPAKDSYFFDGWSIDGVEVIDLTDYVVEDSIYLYPVYTYNWDGTYKGRADSTYELTVIVENQIPVSVSYRGSTYALAKLSTGTAYRTKTGISEKSGSYTYIHFTVSYGYVDGKLNVGYKRNSSSSFDYQGASTSSSFSVTKV